jgi:hypothetical protein
MAADRLRRMSLRQGPVEAHPAEVPAQGLRVLGIARRSGFPSSEKDTTTYAYNPRVVYTSCDLIARSHFPSPPTPRAPGSPAGPELPAIRLKG